MKKIPFVVILFFLLISVLPAQDFSRVLQLQSRRMNGADVTRLQRRLTTLGLKSVGPVDGWYGPLTEGAVKTVQYFLGFPQDGKVTRALWNTIFDPKQDGNLKNISIISNYSQGSLIVTTKRNGTNTDFDEFVVSTLNKEVKAVVFRHVNEGLIIFRFRLWYLADAVFMVQDVYYGDYARRVYLKTTQSFLELKNGAGNPADPAMEGILNRAREGIASAGLTAPQLIPANQPVNSPAAPATPAATSPAPPPPAPATPPPPPATPPPPAPPPAPEPVAPAAPSPATPATPPATPAVPTPAPAASATPATPPATPAVPTPEPAAPATPATPPAPAPTTPAAPAATTPTFPTPPAAEGNK